MRLFPAGVVLSSALLAWVMIPQAGAQGVAGNSPTDVYVLDTVLADPAFWTSDSTALTASLRKTPFRWVSQEKNELRAGAPKMTYLGLAVVEVVIRLPKGKPAEVFLSLYNRGDVGRIADEKFEEFVAKTDEVLAGRAGVSAEDLGDTLAKQGVRATSKAWISPGFSARLDAAYSRVKEAGEGRKQDRPEFVNLTLYPPETKKEDMFVSRKTDAAQVDLKQRVQHKSNGDVIIEGIPMVDQGKKGYCAVATMERILRYYGSEVNQHELAQQANSSGSGTNPDSLVDALRSMGGKLGLRVDERETFESKDFFRLVDDYNKEAKRQKEPMIELQGARVISISDVFGEMKIPVLREVRVKGSSKTEKFLRDTAEIVDRGHPMAWSVQLGWVAETPALPQARGGHMRLIIGYNTQTNEILYTDSWGYGHELKRMSAEDAYFITMGLYVVEPRS